MPEKTNTSTPQRARRQGQRMNAEEKRIAQEAFLEAFAVMANVRAACLKAGIDRTTVYKWQEHDEQFGFKFRQATAEANDRLLAAAWGRAVSGVERPLIYKGSVMYELDEQTGQKRMVTMREYSDTLLSLLLKARLPEFRDKQQLEHTGKDGGPIQTQQVEIYKVRIPDNGRGDTEG